MSKGKKRKKARKRPKASYAWLDVAAQGNMRRFSDADEEGRVVVWRVKEARKRFRGPDVQLLIHEDVRSQDLPALIEGVADMLDQALPAWEEWKTRDLFHRADVDGAFPRRDGEG